MGEGTIEIIYEILSENGARISARANVPDSQIADFIKTVQKELRKVEGVEQ